MAEERIKGKISEWDCCPDLVHQHVCDKLNFRYRLPFHQIVGKRRVAVEVVLHFQLERCSGELVIGDPIYSTTLLPGEQVRLFTSDRHNRWSYDSESNLAYRHQTTSEESYFAAGMAHAMSDLTINQSGVSSSTFEESWAEGGGGASFSFLGFEIGGGGGGGSYDSQSLYAFSRSLSRHAESSSMYVAASVRAKSTTAIGEVEKRTHAEGESEAHYESASRQFQNLNRCHAVTYLFYKLNNIQTIRFKLIAIERRVVDPAAPTGAYQQIPRDTSGRLTILPTSIPATHKNRVEFEKIALASASERLQASTLGVPYARVGGLASSALHMTQLAVAELPTPIDVAIRRKALEAVDNELIKDGILEEKTKLPTREIRLELEWERKEIIPTPGIIVKGCLDKCDTCEPALKHEIKLDLARKELENALLEKKIELLEKSQEYRCCPEESEEDTEEPSNDD
jgi:hypothetical protein